MLIRERMLDDAATGGVTGFVDSGGSVPAETGTKEIVKDTSAGAEVTGFETDEEIIHPKREEIKRPDSIKEIEKFNAEKAAEEGGEEEKELSEYFENDKEYLKELGGDFAEYETVHDALIDMSKKLKEFGGQYESVKRHADKLDGISKKLNVPVDALFEILGGLDPGQNATGVANFQNIDKVLGETRFQNETDPVFFQNFSKALVNDMTPHVEGMVARAFNALVGKLDNMGFEFAYDKFLRKTDKEGNRVNAAWEGRSHEVKQFLDEYPHMRGKPNMIDWAVRGLTANHEPASVASKVNAETKKRLQEIAKKKRLLRQEGGGRGGDQAGGGVPSNVADMNHEQKGDLIDKLEGKGVRLSTRRR